MGKAYADEQLELAFEEYSKALEKFCYTRLGEANEFASDCVQDTYCLFYRKLLDGESFENPRAFLYKTANIMVLKAKDKYFKEAKRTKALDEAENVAVYVEEEFEQKEDDLVDIEKAKSVLIAKLNDNEKELYQLKYVQSKSLKEIGEILDIPPNTVAKRTSRLRAKVSDLIFDVLEEFRKGGS